MIRKSCADELEGCKQIEKKEVDPQQHKQQVKVHNLQPPWTFTLAFKDADVEGLFQHSYQEAATAHDEQAASVYLWMVALGSLLYLAVTAYSPASRPANVDKCSVLILVSWLGPMMHLILLRLLPRATYVRHRTRIILLLRAFYIGATSVNGFGLCGVGPLQDKALHVPLLQQQHHSTPAAQEAAEAAAAAAATAAAGGCPLESPYSAMLWRSGVIGLIWWGAAFPLPLQHHLPIQAASVALYARTLAHTVCDTMRGVRSSRLVLGTIHSMCHSLAAHMSAAVGARGLAARYANMATAAAAAAAASSGGSSHEGGVGCRQVLAFVQLVLGLVLPAFVMYCYEARKRSSWWRNLNQLAAGGNRGSNAAAGGQQVTDGDSSASLASLEEIVTALFFGGEGRGGVPDDKSKHSTTAVGARPEKRQAVPLCARAASSQTQHLDTAVQETTTSSGSSVGSFSSGDDSLGASCSRSSGSSSSSSNGSRISNGSQSGGSNSLAGQQLVARSLAEPQASSKGRQQLSSSLAVAAGCDKNSSTAHAEDMLVDDVCAECCLGGASRPPPGFTDLLVLLVVVGVSWVVLGQVMS